MSDNPLYTIDSLNRLHQLLGDLINEKITQVEQINDPKPWPWPDWLTDAIIEQRQDCIIVATLFYMSASTSVDDHAVIIRNLQNWRTE